MEQQIQEPEDPGAELRKMAAKYSGAPTDTTSSSAQPNDDDPTAALAAMASKFGTPKDTTAAAPLPLTGPKVPSMAPRDVTEMPASNKDFLSAKSVADAEPIADRQRGIMADQVHEEMKGTGEKIADAMTNMATHPVQTVAGIAIAPFEAAGHLGMFASQELRKKQGTWKGDDAISPRDAGFAAAQLIAMGATEAAMPALEGFFGKTMAKGVVDALEKGESPQKVMARMAVARAATHSAIGAGVGALWTPDDPAVGAFIGGLFGGGHALLQKAHVTVARPEADASSMASDRLLTDHTQAPATATARIEREPVSLAAEDESPFSVEMNSPAEALSQLAQKVGKSAPAPEPAPAPATAPGEGDATLLAKIRDTRARAQRGEETMGALEGEAHNDNGLLDRIRQTRADAIGGEDAELLKQIRATRQGALEGEAHADNSLLGQIRATRANALEGEADANLLKSIRDTRARADAGTPAPAAPEITPLQVIKNARDNTQQAQSLLARMKDEHERRSLEREANTDALTGLGNARAFMTALPRAEADPNTAVLRFDLNGFKNVNDTHGHGFGDKILQRAAEAIRRNTKGMPNFRAGGDEFVAFVPHDQADAIRAKVEDDFGVRDFVSDKGSTRVSISGGHGQTSAEADQAAYNAKEVAKQQQGIRGRDVGSVYDAKLHDLDVDPERFQFKGNTNEHGVTKALEGVKWNPDLAGVVSVWRDPADGRLKVINGHHRVELAQRSGVDKISVREIDAPDAASARARGALINMAEDKGTPVDVAKFIRDTGLTMDDIRAEGVNPKGQLAKKGLALSKLHPTLFQQVATGQFPMERGVVIGESGLEPEQQLALKQMLDQREASGKRMSNETLAEMIRFVKDAGTADVSQDSLFGTEQLTHSLAPEKAELSAWVKDKLGKDRRLFNFIAKSERASRIESAGVGNIETERAKGIATGAAQAEEVYNRLSTMKGPVSDALTAAARELANGGDRNEIRSRLYDAIAGAVTEHVQALGGTKEGGASGLSAGREGSEAAESRIGGAAEAGPPDPDQIGFVAEHSPAYETEQPKGVAAFYSRLERAIDAAPFEKGTAEQWKAALSKNVAGGEREWTGVDRLLEQSAGKVLTRAQIRDTFEEGRIHLDETISKSQQEHIDAHLEGYQRAVDEALAEVEHVLKKQGLDEQHIQHVTDAISGLRYFGADDLMEAHEVPKSADAEAAINTALEQVKEYEDAQEEAGDHIATHANEGEFEQYTEPGGRNYREIKIQLAHPHIEALERAYLENHKASNEHIQRINSNALDRRMAAGNASPDRSTIADYYTPEEVAERERLEKKSEEAMHALHAATKGRGPEFKSPHFQEPNILAHTRLKDRTLPNGEKALFVEEIQSDWHQKGRERGYDTREKVQQRYDARVRELKAKIAFLKNAPERAAGDTVLLEQNQRELANYESQLRMVESGGLKNFHGVPDAPFKKTDEWVGLVARRLIDEAVKGGYDRIAWTTGDQQNARYKLEQHISRLVYYPNSGKLDGYQGGKVVFQKNVPANELPDYVGKEVADRLLSPESRKTVDLSDNEGGKEPFPYHVLEGNDLKVGGKGMQSFYDNILPKVFKEQLKKLGVKAEIETVPATKGAQNMSIRITPEVRAAEGAKGQSVMERGGNWERKLNKSREQLDLFTFNGKETSAKDLKAEPDVAQRKGQHAVVRRLVEKIRTADLPSAGERRRAILKTAAMGMIDPVGLNMKSPMQAAYIMTSFRHPAMEILHAYIKNAEGNVVAHVMRTSGELNWAAIPDNWTQEIAELAKANGGETVTFGHNHPSGDPTPSHDDLVVTKMLKDELSGHGLKVDGHIVINHDKATWVRVVDGTDVHGNPGYEAVSLPILESRRQKAPWQTGAEADRPRVKGSFDAAHYLAAVTDPEAATVAFLDTQMRIVAVRPYVAKALETIGAWLLDHIRAHAAKNVIISVPAAVAKDLALTVSRGGQGVTVAGGENWSYPVLDVLGVEHDANGVPGKSVSYAEKGLVNPGQGPSPDKPGSKTILLRPGESATTQVARLRAEASRRGLHPPDKPGGVRETHRVREDLFGNPDESEPKQGSLFSSQEGSPQKLSDTERAARAELTKLREKAELLERPSAKGSMLSAAERIRVAKRIAELEKLVNRDKSISASELKTRARAESAPDDLFGGKVSETATRKPFNEYIGDMRKKIEAKRAPVRAAVGDGKRPVEFQTGPESVEVISREPRDPSKWRVTHFTPDGPVGHQEYAKLEEAIAQVAGSSGENPKPVKGKVQEWMSGDRWRTHRVNENSPTYGTLYHGTRQTGLESLQPSKSGEFGPGVYLADNEDSARAWGHRAGASTPQGGDVHVLPVSADLKNPFHVTKQRWIQMTERRTPRQVQADLMRKGHDGIVATGINGVDKQIVVFDPSKVRINRVSEQSPRYGGQPATKDEVSTWAEQTKQSLGLRHFNVYVTTGGALELADIEVPNNARKQGVGTKALEALTQFADEHGQRIVLTPALKDPKHGTTSRARLVRFYKRFGFVLNKGRNKDFTTMQGMYREPQTPRGKP